MDSGEKGSKKLFPDEIDSGEKGSRKLFPDEIEPTSDSDSFELQSEPLL
jgi:hypothetical protein